MKRSILSLAIVVALAPCLHAESLGAAAKREEERRKKVEETGKGADHVISTEELAANKGRTATEGSTAAPATAPAGSSSGDAAPTAERTRAKPETDNRGAAANWAARAASREAAVKAAETALEEAKSAPLSTGASRTVVTNSGGGYLGSQDYGGSYSDAKREHEEAVAAAQRGLDSARRALDALEDEARRQSIPPGWLRGQ